MGPLTIQIEGLNETLFRVSSRKTEESALFSKMIQNEISSLREQRKAEYDAAREAYLILDAESDELRKTIMEMTNHRRKGLFMRTDFSNALDLLQKSVYGNLPKIEDF